MEEMRMRTLLVGFGHKCRHGKDWVCQRIHEELPQATKIYPLAYSMKMLGQAIFGKKEKDGKWLQAFGTEVGREADANYWIKLLRPRIQEDDPPIALIPDLRFRNEAIWIKSLGGLCIKVERLNEDGSIYADPDRPADHPSETELANFGWDQKIVAGSGNLVGLEKGALVVAQYLQEWLRGTSRWGGRYLTPPVHKNFPRAYDEKWLARRIEL